MAARGPASTIGGLTIQRRRELGRLLVVGSRVACTTSLRFEPGNVRLILRSPNRALVAQKLLSTTHGVLNAFGVERRGNVVNVEIQVRYDQRMPLSASCHVMPRRLAGDRMRYA